MRNSAVACLLILGLGCPRAGGEPPAATRPASVPSSAASTQGAKGVAALPNMQIDFANRQVVISSEVCLRSGGLEFLLCRGNDKAHESILRTAALPSHVHAALLALGLTPGVPARWSAPGEGREPKFLPPEGPQLAISFRWKDKEGKDRQADAMSWLSPMGQRGATMPKVFIFVGSVLLPNNEYLADGDGQIVSLSNFPAAVIDVPFESSSKNELLEFECRTDGIPPLGTPVDVIVSPLPGAEKAQRARVILDIDRFGRLRIDGKPIAPEELADWARGYLADHDKGMVVIHADGRALVFDVERAREELRTGGVRDIDERRFPPEGEPLPRTPEQARQAIQWWAQQFAGAKDLIIDPSQSAQAVLDQIGRQLRELEATKELWSSYAGDLRKMTEQYKASTQPAGKDQAQRQPE